MAATSGSASIARETRRAAAASGSPPAGRAREPIRRQRPAIRPTSAVAIVAPPVSRVRKARGSLVTGVALPGFLTAPVKPWEATDIDTMLMWTGGASGQKIALDRLARALAAAAVTPVAGDLPAMRLGGGATILTQAAVKDFQASLRGPLLMPGQDGYDRARRVWNGMIDRRPALIAQCSGAADVASAVNMSIGHHERSNEPESAGVRTTP